MKDLLGLLVVFAAISLIVLLLFCVAVWATDGT